MLAIIDYGAGNTYNVQKAFAALGVPTVLTRDPAVMEKSSALILPGVGAFRAAMENLERAGLVAPIKEAVAGGKPLLGICLGMQMLFDYSTEYGRTPGLGLLAGGVKKIPGAPGRLVPQVGWNQQELRRPASCFADVDGRYTYFVHSYYARPQEADLVSTVDYGLAIPAIVQRGRVVGMQFHPEKSGAVGLDLLKDFLTGVVKDEG